jgi:hypothetical protein
LTISNSNDLQQKALLMRHTKSDDHGSSKVSLTTPTSRSKRLAKALLADRNREETRDHNIIPCRACGYTFVYKGPRGDLNGRFCSMRCQDWYDAGKNESTRSANDAFDVALREWTTVLNVILKRQS